MNKQKSKRSKTFRLKIKRMICINSKMIKKNIPIKVYHPILPTFQQVHQIYPRLA